MEALIAVLTSLAALIASYPGSRSRAPTSYAWSGGFEAVAVSGVPMGARIAVERATSTVALDAMLAALSAFGYEGTVTVEDATYVGGTQHYEVSAAWGVWVVGEG